ncbi:EamA family transporter RarD [uncultured Ellagibacter sp.]|uniref:EamA family transporter RarD n=1 Tax=uncultured Ellagibacter sp. TaxID=2137580 RepID=UPI00262C2162|nr:EamA family transporter RarD [uncultured Ellagibacter sp.]
MDTEAETQQTDVARGAPLAAVGCYLIWGSCPLFWALLNDVDPVELIGQRIAWSLVLTVIACKFILKVDFIALLRDARARRFLIPSGLLVMVNWSLYIVAMVTNNVVEASLGYYINPLVSIVLGLVVFRERLTPLQVAATALSAAGVIYFAVSYGSFPWIALSLAFTFGIYGAVKKRGGYPAVPTIAVEGIVALPFAIVALVAVAVAGKSAFFSPDMSLAAWQTRLLLVLTGPVTAVPLILFATAANKTPLSLIGFIQYISPTLSLLSGVLVLGEPFTSAHAVCFACIWTGAVLVIADAIRKQVRQR